MIKVRYDELGLFYYANLLVYADPRDGATEVSCFSSLSQYRFLEGCDRFLNTLEAITK
jgi:hypothetical protein